jgi:hypothetical protein
MFDESGAGDQKAQVPEIEIIRDILLKGLQRAHDVRITKLEERVAALSSELESRLGAIVARIETVAAGSADTHKKSLMEIANAIARIASGANLHIAGAEASAAVEQPASETVAESAAEAHTASVAEAEVHPVSAVEADGAAEAHSHSVAEAGNADEAHAHSEAADSADEAHHIPPEGGSASA